MQKVKPNSPQIEKNSEIGKCVQSTKKDKNNKGKEKGKNSREQ